MTNDDIPTLGPKDCGLAVEGARKLAEQTVTAWTDFLDVVADVDVDAPSRVKKTTAREILTRVGTWPQSRDLSQILTDAVGDDAGRIDQDKLDDRVVELNEGRPRAEIFAAIERSRDALSQWLGNNPQGHASFDEVAVRLVSTPLGALPLITYMHAAAFQLAVSARDLSVAGASESQDLSMAGLRALVDTTGALAARAEIDAQFSTVTPAGSVFTVTGPGSWIAGSIDQVGGRDFAGVEGPIGTVLDIASGRQNPLRRITSRDVSVRDVPALLRLAPIAYDNPGLPGGPLLRKTASFLSMFHRD